MPAFDLSLECASIVIVTTTAVTWSLLTLAMRYFIRLKINGPLGCDDYACSVATVFAVAHSIVTLCEIAFGFGNRKTDGSSLFSEQVGPYVTNMLYTIAITFSSLSISYLIARVVSKVRHKKVLAYLIIGATACWGLAGVITWAFQCRLPHPWNIDRPRHCISLVGAWIGLSVGHAALELANVVLAIAVVWKLQMPVKDKSMIVVAFATRLLILPPTFMRLSALR
ncbi:hypothetical protein EJ03DRAFT_349494 [Teratosphaeria nubilosa]|uniref:Rhodopsin domain-containing protein n=1 Tax=Teratosphaeria nubilosa TaxID=161662 RepID=A0A6G1LEW1_9PEZI|nr:hypothetical protein EJ03DRAFT_349494 [Teratosphaeria nubilosa]